MGVKAALVDLRAADLDETAADLGGGPGISNVAPYSVSKHAVVG